MIDEEFFEQKRKLDEELASALMNVGVMFGNDFYQEFERRGLFKSRTFQAVGLPELMAQYPTYADRSTHLDPALPVNGYKVRKRYDAPRS